MSETGAAAAGGMSANDRAVLQFLFNPAIHSPLQAQMHEKTDRSDGHEAEGEAEGEAGEEEALAGMPEEAKKEMQLQEAKAVALVEMERPQEAEALLTQLIEQHPGVASLWLTRGEGRRLAKRYDAALEDASKAVALSMPGGKVVNRKVAKQALAMRGFLLRKGLAEGGGNGMEDLKAAAALGHSLAALECNPYRTLCGNVVEAMMEEQCGIARRK